MALEIERRFLVAGDDWRQHVRWQQELRQGYLHSSADGLTVRVRLSGPTFRSGPAAGPSEEPPAEPRAWLTLKAKATPGQDHPGAALSRLEYEYPIPVGDAGELLQLSGCRIEKRRHGLDLPGGDWVLDVFHADNAPLVVAEVELASPTSALAVPSWCAHELTGRHDLSNAALASRPLAQWSRVEIEALFATV
ncbi:MAG: CYTH domain-containing protein [Cyanobium sp.]